MSSLLKNAWDEVLFPMLQRPSRPQVAALCYRGHGDDKEVLLVTSRGTGRWILPKGWPMDGKQDAEAAAQEAWEEAGVKDGQLDCAPIGEYSYDKELDDGGLARCSAKVFPLRVEKLTKSFPEASERSRKWVSTEEAATMVNEKGLRKLLRAF
ncbi:8-oxo-dGTP pyrophosphatase MutT, NUDIX family [Aliiroseovarius halocynthiae]|uniref:NUDIX hydrolase n=1 Tax=Aliiroseovarius halocynthiae TaxID=985055 RepID=A0A545SZT7_9RHOB|nr:NUDIX hydrolase [Aliiroseovarius halocynthiae]TQV70485.1 NUDIX hydrolase [Aliiroseovarius halocynthiae]SMR81793.1 8-oxo-dGTP pyrophosphatase MutT, NUDIX family [Aliiroseovarius halocynthiae]